MIINFMKGKKKMNIKCIVCENIIKKENTIRCEKCKSIVHEHCAFSVFCKKCLLGKINKKNK